MENNKYKDIFNQSGSCPTSKLLWEYAHHKLDGVSAKELENHLANCSLCAGAVEGYSMMNSPAKLNEIAKQNPYASPQHFLSKAKVILVLTGIVAFLTWWFTRETFDSPLIDTSKTEVLESSGVEEESESRVDEIEDNTFAIIDSTKQAQSSFRKNGNNSTDRWKDELFTIGKRGIQWNNGSPAKLEIMDRSHVSVIYIHDLKVLDFTKKYQASRQIFEVPSNLHPRYANPGERGTEQIYTDVDTVYYRDLLTSALENFSQGNYKQSSEQFSVILKYYPNDENALFYGGLSNTELNDFKSAIVLLKKLSIQSKSTFYEEANWHLALSYLKADNLKEGTERLLKIIEGKGFYAEQATELLRK
jgi:TolA-binding protein